MLSFIDHHIIITIIISHNRLYQFITIIIHLLYRLNFLLLLPGLVLLLLVIAIVVIVVINIVIVVIIVIVIVIIDHSLHQLLLQLQHPPHHPLQLTLQPIYLLLQFIPSLLLTLQHLPQHNQLLTFLIQ